MRKRFTKFSIMAGIQTSNNEIYEPYTFLVNYKNVTKYGNFSLFVLSESQPAHPDANKSYTNDLESKLKSSMNYEISNKKLSLTASLSDVKINAKDLYSYKQSLVGLKIIYSLNTGWNIYYKTVKPISLSQENTLGLISHSGLKGRFALFQENMKINFHIWADTYVNQNDSFTFDPFLQYYSPNRENNFEIIDRNLTHLEIQSNISGVLLNYKIYNLLNALGSSNEDTFFKPNSIYPEIGRMMQFGVTWYFDN